MIKKGWLGALSVALLLLAACGALVQAASYIEDNYSFVDAVQSDENPNARAMMYRSDQSLAATAAELIEVEEPEQIGEEIDGRQVLVYDDEFIILTEDPENPGATLVEIAEEEFVRTYYNPGFFTGMFIGSFLNNRFGSNWAQAGRCGAGGCYSGGGRYQSLPSTTTGRGSLFRGGGLGVGK